MDNNLECKSYKGQWLLIVMITLLVFPVSIHAQDKKYEDPWVDDSILVTATKREVPKKLQDLPLSVTVITEEILEQKNVRELEALSFSIPNVSFSQIGTGRGTANFSIRGLGINSSIPSIDPTVGVFVDGVYLGINDGVVLDLFDVESIEILRGPQGVLFGRNTTGGAVMINTANPTDTFEGKYKLAVESPFGNVDGANVYVQGVVSGPLVPGKLNGRFGAYYNHDDGTFIDSISGRQHGEQGAYILRSAFELMLVDELTVLSKFEYLNSEGDGAVGQNRGQHSRNDFGFSIDEKGDDEFEIFNTSVKAEWAAPFDGVFTYIFGYREVEHYTFGDIDATPQFLFHASFDIEQDQFSNELRYAREIGDKIELVTGFYQFTQNIKYNEIRHLPIIAEGLVLEGGGEQDHTALGLFGVVDYHFNDKITGTFGLRYSYEEKDVTVRYIDYPACLAQATPCDAENSGYSDKNDWHNFTPKIGVSYAFNEATNFYANYTRGVRSGGYNLRVTDSVAFLTEQVAVTGKHNFDEEIVDSIEFGMKYSFADNKGFVNSVVFWSGVQDMQREVNVPSATAGVSQIVTNTADATIYGLESEFVYALYPSFSMHANIGLLSASYDSVGYDLNGDGVVDQIDRDLDIPRAPKFSWGFGFVHNKDFNQYGKLTTRLDLQYRDKSAFTDNNTGWFNTVNMLNVDLEWETPREGVFLSLYGKNLLDEVLAGGDTQLPFGGGNYSDGSAAPYTAPAVGSFSPLKKGRIFGIELTILY